jgi:hypothetical protein
MKRRETPILTAVPIQRVVKCVRSKSLRQTSFGAGGIRAALSGLSRMDLLSNAQYQQIARMTRMEALVDLLPCRKFSTKADWQRSLKKNEWVEKVLTDLVALVAQTSN